MNGAMATRWGLVFLVFVVGAITTMQLGKVPPTLPSIRGDLGISMVTAGWVASLISVIGAVIGVAIGIAADSIGYRRIVVYGLIFIGAGSALGGFADSGAFLLATRFLEGVGYIAIIVAGTPLIAGVCTGKDMDAAMGLWSAYFPLGVGIMILIAPAFLGAFGWRALWVGNAILAGAFLLLFFRATRGVGAAAAPAARQTWADVRTTLARPGPWLLTASFIPMSISVFALTTWMPTFLIEKLGRSPAIAAVYAAVFMLLFIPSNVVGGWLLADPRIKRWHLLAAGGVALGALPPGIIGDGVPEWARIACALVYTQLVGLIPGAVFAGIPAHAPTPRQIGTVAGVLIQGNFLGVLLGPPLLAQAVEALGGWEQSSWVMVLVGALGVTTALGIGWIEARPRPA
jgi:MFS family permease